MQWAEELQNTAGIQLIDVLYLLTHTLCVFPFGHCLLTLGAAKRMSQTKKGHPNFLLRDRINI